MITVDAVHLDSGMQKQRLSVLARIPGVTRMALSQASAPAAQQTAVEQEANHDAQPRIMRSSESAFLVDRVNLTY